MAADQDAVIFASEQEFKEHQHIAAHDQGAGRREYGKDHNVQAQKPYDLLKTREIPVLEDIGKARHIRTDNEVRHQIDHGCRHE